MPMVHLLWPDVSTNSNETCIIVYNVPNKSVAESEKHHWLQNKSTILHLTFADSLPPVDLTL